MSKIRIKSKTMIVMMKWARRRFKIRFGFRIRIKIMIKMRNNMEFLTKIPIQVPNRNKKTKVKSGPRTRPAKLVYSISVVFVM